VILTRRAAWFVATPVAVILVAYVLYPALATFRVGIAGPALPEFFSGMTSTGVRALTNSVWVSLVTVAGAAGVGTSLAWSLWRYDFPGRGAMKVMAALPLALPPLVGVLAFVLLYGETGFLPRTIQALLDLDRVPFRLTGVSGVMLVHVYSFYVFVYLFVAASLRDLDPGLLDASADLGAGGWRTFRHVVIPAVRPALVGAGLLVFMLSMASFTAPLLFAGADPFLTTLIYEAKLNGELALAATAATVLTAICLLFLLGIELWGGHGVPGVGKGARRPAVPVRRGAARAAWGAFLTVALTLIALPIATVILISFADTGAWSSELLPDRFTITNYTRLFTDQRFFAPIVNSVTMAMLATAANLIFGVAAGLVIAGSRLPGRRALSALAMLPFAIPGTVIALNLIVVFIDPSPLAAGRVLVGSFWILPLAYFVRNIPLVVRAATAALEGYDGRLSEASADLGASPARTFRQVLLPAIWPTVMAGTLLAWVAALGEFVASIMLYVFGNRPISIEILAQLRLFEFGAAAAYAVLLMIVVTVSTVIFRRFGAG
jgi:iron(III) transport system permease protein